MQGYNNSKLLASVKANLQSNKSHSRLDFHTKNSVKNNKHIIATSNE